MIKLRKKVGDESLAERRKQQTHRYVTVTHQMKRVEPVVTGSYLQAETQKAALAAARLVKPWHDAAVLTLLLNLSSHERNSFQATRSCR